MDADLKARWVTALRSGEYAQAKGSLRRKDGYCCLGVLCDLYDHDAWESEGPDADAGDPWLWWTWHEGDALLPGSHSFGLHERVPNGAQDFPQDAKYKIQTMLSEMNDDGTPFPVIADWIERWVPDEPSGLVQ